MMVPNNPEEESDPLEDDPEQRLLRDAEGCNVDGQLLERGTLPLVRNSEGASQMRDLPLKVESAVKTLEGVYRSTLGASDLEVNSPSTRSRDELVAYGPRSNDSLARPLMTDLHVGTKIESIDDPIFKRSGADLQRPKRSLQRRARASSS